MADIIITKSRRGLFNEDEWTTFAGPNGAGPVDTRVFFRCRQPSCWRIWTMEQAAYRVIDIEANPIQCAECGSYNITATWCNTKERPYTWIGEAEQATATFHTAYFKPHILALKTFRDANGGQDPTPADGAAYTSFIFLKENMFIWYPPNKTLYQELIDVDGDGDKELTTVPYPYSDEQYFEIFHKVLPRIDDDNFYNAEGEATLWKIKTTPPILKAKQNYNFYRCVVNMVIQTEHTGGTGGSGA